MRACTQPTAMQMQSLTSWPWRPGIHCWRPTCAFAVMAGAHRAADYWLRYGSTRVARRQLSCTE